jgi:hypothetical protein
MQAMNVENMLAHVPKPDSGDYLARSARARTRGYNLRIEILSFVINFFRSFNVSAKSSAFLQKIHKVDSDFSTIDFCGRARQIRFPPAEIALAIELFPFTDLQPICL